MAAPGQEFLDSEPMLPEEYEDPDDEDVFLNDVMDQKVACGRPRDASRSVSRARF